MKSNFISLELFKKALQNGCQKLIASYKQLNLINFFPVADSDTGTNMLLTIKEAFDRLEKDKSSSFNTLFDWFLDSVISSAQGNSGLIFSQFFVSCQDFFSKKENESKVLLTVSDFQKILFLTEEKMKSVVVSPLLKGTMIFVMIEGNRKLSLECGTLKKNDFCSIFNLFLEGCQEGLEKTKFQLPVLKENNVVDAGGKGLVVFFNGFYETISRECCQKQGIDRDKNKVEKPKMIEIKKNNETNQVSCSVKNNGCLNVLFLSKKKITLELKNQIKEKILQPEFSSVAFFWKEQQLKVHIHTQQIWNFLNFFIKNGFVVKKIVWQAFSHPENNDNLSSEKKIQVISSYLDKETMKKIKHDERICFSSFKKNNFSFDKVLKTIINKVCEFVFFIFNDEYFFTEELKSEIDTLKKIFSEKKILIVEEKDFSLAKFFKLLKRIEQKDHN